jgi:hypothetical protein
MKTAVTCSYVTKLHHHELQCNVQIRDEKDPITGHGTAGNRSEALKYNERANYDLQTGLC